MATAQFNRRPPPDDEDALYLIVYIVFLFALGMLVFSLSSCVTEKQRARICASCTKDSVSASSDTTRAISVRVDTAWRLLEVPIQGPIQYLPHPCANLCDSLGRLKSTNQVSHRQGMYLRTFSRNDSLINECAEDSLMAVIENHKIDTEILNRSYEEKIRQVAKDRELLWYDVAGRWALGLDALAILLLIVLGAIKIFK